MKLKVENMNCKHCVEKIEKALLIAGVDAKINLKKKTVEVIDEQSDIAIKAIENAGYVVAQ